MLGRLRFASCLGGVFFLDDKLARYGYLENPQSAHGLPVGFTLADAPGGPSVGMNCAACHTREIQVGSDAYRIDGGPAIVDFEALLLDLDRAMAAALSNDSNFSIFAASVLGENPAPDQLVALKADVEAWFLQFDTLVKRALPRTFGGPGRVDAIAMIFNRLSGLDIGTEPNRIIAANIQPADAPVRYPFLWNAAKQDRTQWTGFAANGNDILGLARNLGEVYGVFAHFEPVKKFDFIVDFRNRNSANFTGLNRLEQMIRKLQPPKWPFPVDTALAAKGAAIYNRPTGEGGCVACHNTDAGKVRFLNNQTWKTPVLDVGTDTRAYQIVGRQVDTGMLQGVSIPLLTKPLGKTDTAMNVLTLAVLGTILEDLPSALDDGSRVMNAGLQDTVSSIDRLEQAKKDLAGAFDPSGRDDPEIALPQAIQAGVPAPSGKFAFESRAMQGIWAAAPYLHNGSVPTLEDLLKPSDQRSKTFTIGPNYDVAAVGIAKVQTKFTTPLVTTGCENLGSGNSNCGHEFGTSLPADDKKALLEYLKTL